MDGNQCPTQHFLGPRITPLKNKVLKSSINFTKEYSRFSYDFFKFLKLHSICELGYHQVFCKPLLPHILKESIHFGWLLFHLNIPSEDLEIALAAISSKATFFVSKDGDLMKNWKSIGINAHFPQPIFMDKAGKFCGEDISTKWLLSKNPNNCWLEEFKNYVKIYPEQFNDIS